MRYSRPRLPRSTTAAMLSRQRCVLAVLLGYQARYICGGAGKMDADFPQNSDAYCAGWHTIRSTRRFGRYITTIGKYEGCVCWWCCMCVYAAGMQILFVNIWGFGVACIEMWHVFLRWISIHRNMYDLWGYPLFKYNWVDVPPPLLRKFEVEQMEWETRWKNVIALSIWLIKNSKVAATTPTATE